MLRSGQPLVGAEWSTSRTTPDQTPRTEARGVGARTVCFCGTFLTVGWNGPVHIGKLDPAPGSHYLDEVQGAVLLIVGAAQNQLHWCPWVKIQPFSFPRAGHPHREDVVAVGVSEGIPQDL